jgi:hypothetical protein
LAEKDGSVKFGSTKCDFCSEPATETAGKYVVCPSHRTAAVGDAKVAAETEPTLKSAAIGLQDAHK